MKDIDKYKIITIQAQTIYDKDRIADKYHLPKGIIIRDEKNDIDFTKFNGYLDRSLETEKMAEVYKGIYHKDDKFCITKKSGDFVDNYTTAVIGLLFKYAHHEYNRQKTIKGYVFVKDGYSIEYDELKNHVLIKDNVLVAIEVPYNKERLMNYEVVDTPISDDLLGKYFEYDYKNKCYVLKSKNGKDIPIKVIASTRELREYVYKNGFYCDGKHYVRYKRSAGSSREGHCLFIQENLYNKMMEWTECGINKDNISDLASWEAYISLTLSNMEKEIKIPHKAILVMRDQYINLKDENVICVFNNEEGNLEAKEKLADVENNIWDGEALLDESIFIENGYESKGMMLLRNKFFKACAFNCKIQKWFEDNNITKISELNGYTKARDIKDIKLIVTESSIKYLKLNNIKRDSSTKEFNNAVNNWIKQIGTSFGVVKTDKKTSYFNGQMVQTSYQLINTLNMNDVEIEKFLSQTIDYLQNLRSESKYMRYYLKARLEENAPEDIESMQLQNEDYVDHLSSDEINILNSRFKAVLSMLNRSESFTHTQIYKDLRKDVTNQIKEKIRQGRVLVNGTYATILGNGSELLKFSINKNGQLSLPELNGNEIYIKRFQNDKQLLCARSPHITMGNLLLAINKHNEFYDKYFNLSDEIVCVNAMNFNIQQRLNGCDYDSDTMLITDNKIMLDAAERNYKQFLVPVCNIDAEKKQRANNNIEKIDLDQDISNNSIGEIVNLSQYLNSILWHKINSNENKDDWENLYLDICKLAVLSGIEIDSAKKQYNVKKYVELNNLKNEKQQYVEKYGIPKFFLHITEDVKKRKKGKLDIKSDKGNFTNDNNEEVVLENELDSIHSMNELDEYDYDEEINNDEELDFGDDYLDSNSILNEDNKISVNAENKENILVESNIDRPIILTNMERIYDQVSKLRGKPGKFNYKLVHLIDPLKISEGENDYKYKKECLDLTDKVAKELNIINKQKRIESGDKSYLVEKEARTLFNYYKELSKKLKTGKVIKLLIEKLEEVTIDKDGKERRYKNRSLLFTAICSDPEQKFYNMLKTSDEKLFSLVPIRSGITNDKIYDTYFNTILLKNLCKKNENMI